MNYASLHASLGQTPVPQKKQTIALTYNKPVAKPPTTTTTTPAATASSAPNTIMLRDSNSSTNISNINVQSKLTVLGEATVSGTMKMNGPIDTSLGVGIVCSNSSGILSSRRIISTDIDDLSIRSQDIRDGAITTRKLASNLFLEGVPTCDYVNVVNEKQIANVGYINRYVTKYVNNRLLSFQPKEGSSADCDVNDSDSDEEELDPSAFHIKTNDYIVAFNFATYIIENKTAVINLPRKKKEGYFVKFHNKSGDTIFINSVSDRLMYNTWYSPNGVTSQAILNNWCVIFTYVYSGDVRSWSYQCF